jgi:hypothetical protein
MYFVGLDESIFRLVLLALLSSKSLTKECESYPKFVTFSQTIIEINVNSGDK